MKKINSSLRSGLFIATLTGCIVGFQNCSQASFGPSGEVPASSASNSTNSVGTDVTAGIASSPLASSSSSSVPSSSGVAICNPLGSSATSSTTQGILANVFYVPQAVQAQVTLNNYTDLINNSVPLNSPVYLPDLDVPTSPWTDGFSDDGAAPLQDNSGNPLLKYFGLTAQTQLQLGANDTDGYYQFATISDDGALITTTLNGSTVTLAGSTGNWHSSTSECGTTPVQITHTNPLPLNIVYYQGPPTEIAMTTLWRYVSDPKKMDFTECGVTSGNFFQTDDDSQPLIEKMEAKGWSVVPASNYYLLPSAGPNPCSSSTKN